MESLAKVMELGYCRCRSEVDYISFQKANDTVKGVTARGRLQSNYSKQMQIGNEGKASTPFGENSPYYPTSLVAEWKNDDIYSDDYEGLSKVLGMELEVSRNDNDIIACLFEQSTQKSSS
ncbi:hypothetical protein TNIN_194521 [Trichonephila inaurata madagascariensis]|uniref:Uncharacterized protein n=1 Tax=Trichonephila inaurata madagascariensis TaxID=2747483 RepID=A0A8X7CCF1_9ARAC|nr:hypothetical protein TNIN_194521 [Trichonephila inaurata madagascariensis]